jgi:hypothetical protein
VKLQKDLKEFLRLLHFHGVEFIIVGAHTFAFYGVPRYTGDIDFFVRADSENAIKLEAVIQEFGFGALGLSRKDFVEPDQVIQLGVAPNRIDLLTGLSGVTFDEAWATKLQAELDGIPVITS